MNRVNILAAVEGTRLWVHADRDIHSLPVIGWTVCDDGSTARPVVVGGLPITNWMVEHPGEHYSTFVDAEGVPREGPDEWCSWLNALDRSRLNEAAHAVLAMLADGPMTIDDVSKRLTALGFEPEDSDVILDTIGVMVCLPPEPDAKPPQDDGLPF